jgi:flavodoxin
MKTAIVIYSCYGNSAFVAEQLKAHLNADVIQLYTKDEKKRSMAGTMFWGGGMTLFHKKPPLKPYEFDPAAYDLIILGVPVWAGSPAPPIQTFLAQTAVTGKKVALFVCHGGGAGKSLKKFRAMLPGCEIVSEADFVVPLKNKEEAQLKIAEWVKQIK